MFFGETADHRAECTFLVNVARLRDGSSLKTYSLAHIYNHYGPFLQRCVTCYAIYWSFARSLARSVRREAKHVRTGTLDLPLLSSSNRQRLP
jgi:hypothetical protein